MWLSASPEASWWSGILASGPGCLALLCCPRSPDAYGQSLEALLTQPAASETVSGVPEDGSRMPTHDHDGSEAPDESPDSILSSEPMPLGKHRPPPPPSTLSPGESSYPP
ncbi:hypothetical protein Tco_0838050 [Tanacetum coccineum]